MNIEQVVAQVDGAAMFNADPKNTNIITVQVVAQVDGAAMFNTDPKNTNIITHSEMETVV